MYFNLGGYIFNENYLQSIRKLDDNTQNKTLYKIVLNKNLHSEEIFTYENLEQRDNNYCKLIECIEEFSKINIIR